MGERRNAWDVEHLQARVAERLAEQKPRLRPYRRAPLVELAGIDERGFDPEARQREIEQIVRSAIERARGDDVRSRAE